MKKNIILDILQCKSFNTFIEYIFIFPLLYLIQYNYNKFKYITLFLAVFILIKNVIVLNIMGLLKIDYIKNTRVPYLLIYKLIKMFIGIIFFFLQFKYRFLVNYNIWIANLYYLKYFIKFISSGYSINSVTKLQNKFMLNINLTK